MENINNTLDLDTEWNLHSVALMIEVISRRTACSLLAQDYSQMPAITCQKSCCLGHVMFAYRASNRLKYCPRFGFGKVYFYRFSSSLGSLFYKNLRFRFGSRLLMSNFRSLASGSNFLPVLIARFSGICCISFFRTLCSF